MKSEFTIGELAKAADVPTSTVRYYERAGLIQPSGRTAANYRVYSAEDVQRLRFVRAAQATSFTLDDIAELLQAAPCGDVQERIEARLSQVSERIKELRHVERVLRASLKTCQEHEKTGRCQVIDALSAAARAK